jgi:hypothetical protein
VGTSYSWLAIERHTYDASGRTDLAGEPDGRRGTSVRDGLKETLLGVLADPGHATRLAHMQATPSRAAHLDRIVEASLLLPEDVVELFPDRKITDPAWAVLSFVNPDAGASQPMPDAQPVFAGKVRSWSLRLLTAGDTRWIDINPYMFPATELPTRAILTALDDLAADGWKVIHVSEDRQIDDAANRSYVIAQRMLLARSIGVAPNS